MKSNQYWTKVYNDVIAKHHKRCEGGVTMDEFLDKSKYSRRKIIKYYKKKSLLASLRDSDIFDLSDFLSRSSCQNKDVNNFLNS